MNDYYNLLKPLTAAVIDYINDPSEVVTGYSLGYGAAIS